MTPRRKQLRAQVEARDKGVCAECKLDCNELKARYSGSELIDEWKCSYHCLRCAASFTESSPSCPSCGWTKLRRKPAVDARKAMDRELAALGYSIPWLTQLRANGARKTCNWFEADHVIPLAEGGEDSLDNMVTLCWPHHSQKTAGQAYRRKVANKSAKRKAARAERKERTHEGQGTIRR